MAVENNWDKNQEGALESPVLPSKGNTELVSPHGLVRGPVGSQARKQGKGVRRGPTSPFLFSVLPLRAPVMG